MMTRNGVQVANPLAHSKLQVSTTAREHGGGHGERAERLGGGEGGNLAGRKHGAADEIAAYGGREEYRHLVLIWVLLDQGAFQVFVRSEDSHSCSTLAVILEKNAESVIW